jgi:hypothetical protein
MKKLITICLAVTVISAASGVAQAAGDITLNIKDLQGNDVAPGDYVKGDVWGVSQPTAGGGYTWHHMVKDAVAAGSGSSVTWTNTEIVAKVGDLSTTNFWFAANAWGGNPWANTQICSPTALWSTFMEYDPTEVNKSWDVGVITSPVFPGTSTATGVTYALDLGTTTFLDSWATVTTSYKDCAHDIQPALSQATKAYMEGIGYSFSFNATDDLLTLTNSSTGFDQTYSAREDGIGGYIQEMEALGSGTVSYDSVAKELSVGIDFGSMGLNLGDTFFCKPGFDMAPNDTNYGTYTDVLASVSPGYVGHTLDPLTVVPEPATICLLGLGGLSLIRRKRKA